MCPPQAESNAHAAIAAPTGQSGRRRVLPVLNSPCSWNASVNPSPKARLRQWRSLAIPCIRCWRPSPSFFISVRCAQMSPVGLAATSSRLAAPCDCEVLRPVSAHWVLPNRSNRWPCATFSSVPPVRAASSRKSCCCLSARSTGLSESAIRSMPCCRKASTRRPCALGWSDWGSSWAASWCSSIRSAYTRKSNRRALSKAVRRSPGDMLRIQAKRTRYVVNEDSDRNGVTQAQPHYDLHRHGRNDHQPRLLV